jgi:putative copper export protein
MPRWRCGPSGMPCWIRGLDLSGQCGLVIVLVAFLLTRGDVSTRRNWIAARGEAFALAALALILLGASGHAAAISESPWPLAIDMVHLLGAGIWVGGLPPLALLLYAASRHVAIPDAYAVRAMQRFSRVALVTVLVLVGSGIANALLLVESVAGLVGTAHGHLLLAKLALLVPVLLLAAANRALLPALSGPNEAKSSATARRMALFIALEAGLVLVLLGFAAAMTVTTPATHGDPVWPWPVRLSLDAFSLGQLRSELVLMGLGLALLAVAFLARRARAPDRIGFRPSRRRRGDQPAAIDGRCLPDLVCAPAGHVSCRLDCCGDGGLPGALCVLPWSPNARP